MTLSYYSYSSPRCIDGFGLNQFEQGSYLCVTSGSAITTIPHWLLPPDWLLPPEASTALIGNPLALWSLTGIGFLLVLLADTTSVRGMARICKCYYSFHIYINCILFYCCCISIPQPCLYPIATPYTTVAPVVPECDSLDVNLSH